MLDVVPFRTLQLQSRHLLPKECMFHDSILRSTCREAAKPRDQDSPQLGSQVLVWC